MKNLWQKIKGLKSRLHSSSIYSRKGIRPSKDWEIILTVALIVIVAEVLWGAYLYSGIKSGTLFIASGGEDIGRVTLSEPLLKKISGEVKDRKSAFDEAIAGAEVPGDPSK